MAWFVRARPSKCLASECYRKTPEDADAAALPVSQLTINSPTYLATRWNLLNAKYSRISNSLIESFI